MAFSCTKLYKFGAFWQTMVEGCSIEVFKSSRVVGKLRKTTRSGGLRECLKCVKVCRNFNYTLQNFTKTPFLVKGRWPAVYNFMTWLKVVFKEFKRAVAQTLFLPEETRPALKP